jgi:PAS domain S-box-containing protein
MDDATANFKPEAGSELTGDSSPEAGVMEDPALLENITDGFIALSPQWELRFFNSAAERVFGRSRTGLIGRNFWQEFSHMLGTTYDDLLHESLATQLPMHFDEFCRCCGAWLEVHAYPGKNGLSVYFRDISARKRVEEQLERLAAFPKCSPDPVIQFDRSGRVIYANEAITRLGETLGGGAIEPLLPPDLTRLISSCLESGKDVRDREVSCNGHTLSWSFFPVSALDAVYCYGSDITSRLRLEGRLRESKKMESIGQLAGGIAHDFNNLLTAIQGHASLLAEEENLTPETRDGLSQISAASERAAELTRQLLTLGRRRVIQLRLLDLNAIIRGRLNFIRTVASENVELEFHPTEDLPAIHADEGLLDQMLMNLVVNARDAMPDGGRLVLATSITNGSEDPGEEGKSHCVRLTVQDTGCGMDAATREKIFEPFFTTKAVGKGTGLGLAIVYGVIKQHKGLIEVSSEPGEGTTFDIFLPHCREAAVEEGSSQSPKPTPVSGTETVLVVEDEAVVRHVVCRVLKQYGYRVLEAADGDKALAVWDQHADEIDLLFTDVVMPGSLNGAQLGQALLAQKPELKVIYSSGHNVELVAGNFELRPGLRFLQKPYRPQALLQAVRECLDESVTPSTHRTRPSVRTT